ncbi:toll/interleukin-1 receptor domain-containing protein [Candidatus Poriferisodalis sp.]|uniref:toll/interleukin-1 receptor domain-containing protein n=1 Tax=Candidatus Poriferisodalis sp. TaxID=3101277 RepID=UPI003B58DE8F
MSQEYDQARGFFSYSRDDDDHEGQRLTAIRHRFAGEISVLTGSAFSIFQDRKDILLGQDLWDRIQRAITNAHIFIAIVTPNYLKSPACRRELELFRDREMHRGRNDLIFPIRYFPTRQLEDASDDIAVLLRSRLYDDWTDVRFEPLNSQAVGSKIQKFATDVIRALDGLRATPAPRDPMPGRLDSEELLDGTQVPETIVRVEQAQGTLEALELALAETESLLIRAKQHLHERPYATQQLLGQDVHERNLMDGLQTHAITIEQLSWDFLDYTAAIGVGLRAVISSVRHPSGAYERDTVAEIRRLLLELSDSLESLDSRLPNLRRILTDIYPQGAPLRPIVGRILGSLQQVPPNAQRLSRFASDIEMATAL